MAQESPSPRQTQQDVHADLEAISELLRGPHRLDSAAQVALADLVDELDKALKLGNIPNEEAARLAATACHFAEAFHRDATLGVLNAARVRLDAAAAAVENSVPVVAELARRFIAALANIGI